MNSRIEFGELRINEASRRHVQECLDTNWVTMGPKVKQFEWEWGKLFGYKHVRMLSSGTAADTACCMALYELGANEGDEVIVPALSFIASATAIRASGFRPVFVDIEKATLQIDVSKIEAAITPRTRAIMAVNLMGKPCDLAEIRQICDDYNLYLIVDNCEAYGSVCQGKYSLEYADFETTSHFTAHICQSVEGGTVSTNIAHYDAIIEAVRNHGRMGSNQYFDHKLWGLNFKPSDLHASIGLGQVEEFCENFQRRQWIVDAIHNGIRQDTDKFWLVEESPNDMNAPHAVSITMKQPNTIQGLRAAFDRDNIAWKRNFGSIPTQHGVFQYLGYAAGSFPNAEWVGDNGIHIGVHRYLTNENIDRIIKCISRYMKTI